MTPLQWTGFTPPFTAQALMESSKDHELEEPIKPKVKRTLSAEKRARMQEELDKLEREYKLIKDDRGQKNLVLQFTKNYLGRLLDNKHVERFLRQNHPDILEEFQKITDMASLRASDPKSS